MIDDKITELSLIDIPSINVLMKSDIISKSIDEYVADLKECFKLHKVPPNAAKVIYSVFIEQMNNVLMYSETKGSNEPLGSLLFGEDGEMFFVQTINILKDSDKKLVKRRIDILNKLDRNEIRQYYKECIKTENINPNSKGAGLGLVDIAKRTDAPIEYLFQPLDRELSFFTMLIKIKKK